MKLASQADAGTQMTDVAAQCTRAAPSSTAAGQAASCVGMKEQEADSAQAAAVVTHAEMSPSAELERQQGRRVDALPADRVASQRGRMTLASRMPPACPRGHSVSQAVPKSSPRASRCEALTEFGTALPGSRTPPCGGQRSPPKPPARMTSPSA